MHKTLKQWPQHSFMPDLKINAQPGEDQVKVHDWKVCMTDLHISVRIHTNRMVLCEFKKKKKHLFPVVLA